MMKGRRAMCGVFRKVIFLPVLLIFAGQVMAQTCLSDTSSWQNAHDMSAMIHNVACFDSSTGAVNYQNLRGSDKALDASGFPGTDAGAKIAACVAALPITGGVCDARALTGAQSVSSNMLSGVIKPFVLLLGAGTYTISVTQTITSSDASIIGLGPSKTVITPTKPFTMFMLDGAASRIRIEGIRFLGVSTGADTAGAVATALTASGSALVFRDNLVTGTNQGVHITGSSYEYGDCVIDHNTFGPFNAPAGTMGVYAVYTTSIYNQITNNYFYNIPRHDIYLSGNTATQSARFNVVEGNISIGNQSEAIAAFSTSSQLPVSDNIIDGNIIVSPAGIGVGLDGGTVSNIISNNIIDRANRGPSIQLNGGTMRGSYPEHNVISGNIIKDATNASGWMSQIVLINASYNRVLGNTITGSGTDYGIRSAETGANTLFPTGNLFEGNSVIGAFDTGIVIDANSFDTRVANNYVSGTTRGSFSIAGARTLSSGNMDGTSGAFTVSSAVNPALIAVKFSATPTFDTSLGNTQTIILAGNVTSSRLLNATTGETINFIICQDSAGSHTFVWPPNVKGGMTVGPTASKCSSQSFIYSGSNAYAVSSGVSDQ